jgi:hypothetical protein
MDRKKQQVPSLRFAALGMTKGRVVLSGEIGQWLKESQALD